MGGVIKVLRFCPEVQVNLSACSKAVRGIFWNPLKADKSNLWIFREAKVGLFRGWLLAKAPERL